METYLDFCYYSTPVHGKTKYLLRIVLPPHLCHFFKRLFFSTVSILWKYCNTSKLTKQKSKLDMNCKNEINTKGRSLPATKEMRSIVYWWESRMLSHSVYRTGGWKSKEIWVIFKLSRLLVHLVILGKWISLSQGSLIVELW